MRGVAWSARFVSALSVLALGLPLAAAQPPAGTRIVHYASSASIPAALQTLVPNPNGGWINRATGQRFSAEDTAGAGGHGYTVVDIVYSDASVCVGSITALGLDPLTNGLTTLGNSGFATNGSCSDFWRPPGELQAMAPQEAPVRISKGRLDFGGSVFDVVGIANLTAGASSNQVFDLAGGLLLFSDSATTGAGVVTPGPNGQAGTAAGNTLMTHSSLLGIRSLPLVAASPALPDHVTGLRGLSYDCQTGTSLMGTQVMIPCRQDVAVVAGGAGWLLLRVVTQTADPITGIPTTAEFDQVMGAAQLFGYYLSPQVAAGWSNGMTVDQDPVTGATAVVVQADGGVVAIEQRLSLESTTYVYDVASGWLIEAHRYQQIGQGVYELHLSLGGVF